MGYRMNQKSKARLGFLVRLRHFDDPRLVALMAVAHALRLVLWVFTRRTWEDALIKVLYSENFCHGLGLTHFNIYDPKPLHGFTSPISVLMTSTPKSADNRARNVFGEASRIFVPTATRVFGFWVGQVSPRLIDGPEAHSRDSLRSR